jgi:hypothetical protein
MDVLQLLQGRSSEALASLATLFNFHGNELDEDGTWLSSTIIGQGIRRQVDRYKAVFRYLERSHASVLEQLVSLVRTTTINV